MVLLRDTTRRSWGSDPGRFAPVLCSTTEPPHPPSRDFDCYTVKPVLNDHTKHEIFLAFYTGGFLLLHEGSAERSCFKRLAVRQGHKKFHVYIILFPRLFVVGI